MQVTAAAAAAASQALVNTLPLVGHHCSLAFGGERASHIWATLWDLGILNIILHDLWNTCWWHGGREQRRSTALCSSPANHLASFSCWRLGDWGPDLTKPTRRESVISLLTPVSLPIWSKVLKLAYNYSVMIFNNFLRENVNPRNMDGVLQTLRSRSDSSAARPQR